MGLDIAGKSHLRLVGASTEYDEELDVSPYISQYYINPDFPHAVPEEYTDKQYILVLETEGTERLSFRAGSYSGYGVFRSTLAGAFLGTEDLYNNADDWERVYDSFDKPFYEIVNFSDCEGVFIGEVCEKLYGDFKACREEYIEWRNVHSPHDAWSSERLIKVYDNFTEAFNLARHNGVVVFH